MAYTKTLWKNRIVERPKTFKMQQNADTTVTLVPQEGQVTEPGTPVNAANMNKIEDTIYQHDLDIDNYRTHKTIKEIHRKITFGTATPTGGVDGDIYFQYE